jgi:hypothetical protein
MDREIQERQDIINIIILLLLLLLMIVDVALYLTTHKTPIVIKDTLYSPVILLLCNTGFHC